MKSSSFLPILGVVILVSAVVSSGAPGISPVSGEPSAVLALTKPSETGGASSFSAGISRDARQVLFLSAANNFVTNDSLNPWLDVFLRDRTGGATVLISVDADGIGGGNGNSLSPVASSNAAWIAFESTASNLVPDDTNDVSDVFLRDVITGQTHLVSRGIDGRPGNGISENPLISEDSRYVVYESQAGNLISGGILGTREVFLYDRVDQIHQRVSTALIFPGQTVTSNGPAHSASMTPDARQIAYVRSTKNQTGRILDGEIFVWDARSASTYWISAGVSSNLISGLPAVCFNPTLSADGRFVVFKENSGGSGVSLYRRANPPELNVPAELVATNVTVQGWAAVSLDGRWVAYQSADGVRLWDGQSGNNRLVLGNLSAPGWRVCSRPALSADGSRMVFLVSSNDASSIYLYDQATELTTIVARTSDGRPAVVSDATRPLLSEDGQSIVFDSADDSLVPGDANQSTDVFASELPTGAAVGVSVRAAALPSVTPPVPSQRWTTSLSADGRVAAVSASDLGDSDTNQLADLYVRDLVAGDQTYLGRPTASSRSPVLSADGRYVAYLSVNLMNYLPGRSLTDGSVYRRDLQTGANFLVHSAAVWDSMLSTLAISPDGNRVAFVDRNTVPNTLPLANGYQNIYVRDIAAGTVELVSYRYSPFPNVTLAGLGDSTDPRFTPDGRWLVFRSIAQNLTATPPPYGYGLYARDLVRQETVLLSSSYQYQNRHLLAISADSRHVAGIEADFGSDRVAIFNLESRIATPVTNSAGTRTISLSADGRLLAYDRKVAATGFWNIYVRDLERHTDELISLRGNSAEPTTRHSSNPTISHDGRYVVFQSQAADLVSGDTNGFKDVFIRDRLRGVTLLASLNSAGTGPGNAPSILPILAGDGRTLLFQSLASDLMPGDFNETTDVFLLRLGGTDTDGDGMDDDWEIAYFGSRDRDGAGDLDSDGISDANELRLGTDPTNAGSVFHVMTLTREGGAGTRLLWSASPGRSYVVQFKDDLAAHDWLESAGIVTAAGTTATWTDPAPSPGAKRFYRVAFVR